MKKFLAVIAFVFLFVLVGCTKVPKSYYFERGESYETGSFVIALESYELENNLDESFLLKVVVSIENTSNTNDTFTFKELSVSAPGKDDFYKMNPSKDNIDVKAHEKETKEFQVTILKNIERSSTFRFKDGARSIVFYLMEK